MCSRRSRRLCASPRRSLRQPRHCGWVLRLAVWWPITALARWQLRSPRRYTLTNQMSRPAKKLRPRHRLPTLSRGGPHMLMRSRARVWTNRSQRCLAGRYRKCRQRPRWLRTKLVWTRLTRWLPGLTRCTCSRTCVKSSRPFLLQCSTGRCTTWLRLPLHMGHRAMSTFRDVSGVR